MRSLWAPVLASVVLAAAPAYAGPQEGRKAPSLGQVDVIQGEPFTELKDLKGHVIRLVFFATW